MTRKVTVTFEDGTQKVYPGVPDNSTAAMIEAEVKKEYKRIDKEALFKEQSILLSKINRMFRPTIYSNFAFSLISDLFLYFNIIIYEIAITHTNTRLPID